MKNNTCEGIFFKLFRTFFVHFPLKNQSFLFVKNSISKWCYSDEYRWFWNCLLCGVWNGYCFILNAIIIFIFLNNGHWQCPIFFPQKYGHCHRATLVLVNIVALLLYHVLCVNSLHLLNFNKWVVNSQRLKKNKK